MKLQLKYFGVGNLVLVDKATGEPVEDVVKIEMHHRAFARNYAEIVIVLSDPDFIFSPENNVVDGSVSQTTAASTDLQSVPLLTQGTVSTVRQREL